ncbi:IDEAL domain-containing protein [Bacillus salitolerans]|uniref:IDEAL domain-containing protein n=1 Tax=Bacillus salitolerans TaxID=1437434 RepID=A0ABW4LVN5_9BACI
MKKGKSYTELMKSAARKRLEVQESRNFYVDMILDEIIFNSKAKKLNKEIDVALDNRDLKTFYKLSNEYKQLMKHA